MILYCTKNPYELFFISETVIVSKRRRGLRRNGSTFSTCLVSPPQTIHPLRPPSSSAVIYFLRIPSSLTLIDENIRWRGLNNTCHRLTHQYLKQQENPVFLTRCRSLQRVNFQQRETLQCN